MRFEFATAGRIIFGNGVISEIGSNASTLGKRAFVVVNSLDRSAHLMEILRGLNLVALPFPIEGEPAIPSIVAALQAARKEKCDLVIGMGGGSAMDTGKTLAVLLNNPGELQDYLEVVGKGRVLEKPSLPFIAIPTTAGTGSEVTRNAVISVPEHRIKVSLRSPFMLPRLALIDPELTYSLPPDVTAYTGLDALTQLIEPFVSNSPNLLVDGFCREGIVRVTGSLLKAFKNGQDVLARENMALASMLSGLALANGRLGAVHGMANPIGGVSNAPHGAICARLLPLVMESNLKAIRARVPDSPALVRYDEVARLLTGNDSVKADTGVFFVKELCSQLNIRPLQEYGLRLEDIPELVEQSQKTSSMKGNPVPLANDEIRHLLETAG
jgi:alcohol dehydrogenase class IV